MNNVNKTEPYFEYYMNIILHNCVVKLKKRPDVLLKISNISPDFFYFFSLGQNNMQHIIIKSNIQFTYVALTDSQ